MEINNIKTNPLSLLGYASGLLLVFYIAKVFYNLFFHPLRAFPGPWYAGASRFWYSYKALKKTLPFDIKKLHDRYGDVVRIAPEELSFISPEAWQTIYGRQTKAMLKGNSKLFVFAKDPTFYVGVYGDSNTLADTEGELHTQQARVLAPAFRRAAILGQEPLIRPYMDKMVQAMRRESAEHDVLDFKIWTENTLMDITGILTWGKDLKGLDTANMAHPAPRAVSQAFGFIWIYMQFRRLPAVLVEPLERVFKMLAFRFRLLDRIGYIGPDVNERMVKGNEHSDYVTYLQSPLGQANGMDDDTIKNTVNFLFFAGVESSSTYLMGILYHLIAHPEAYRKAAAEVRSMFAGPDDITIAATESMPYLGSCMIEGARLYPPITGALPRRVPAGGYTIAGRFVPGDAVVGCTSYAAYHSETNFPDCEAYKPERWLGTDATPAQSKGVYPFSLGPRVCLGKDLALILTRMYIAHILLAFDVELAPASENWHQGQKAYIMAHRMPLFVKVRAVDAS